MTTIQILAFFVFCFITLCIILVSPAWFKKSVNQTAKPDALKQRRH
jgi:hypothetical protein